MRYWLILILLPAGLLAGLSGCGQTAETTLPTQAAPALSAVTAVPSAVVPETTDVSATAVTATETPLPPATPTASATAVADTTSEAAATSVGERDGALIAVSMSSRVGVLLDEFPAEMRDRVAAAVLAQPADAWLERAAHQVRLTRLRLNFRNFVYPDKGQLPLPPAELWSLTLDPAGARRETVDGRDLVLMDYTFASTLLTDSDSPARAEPALAAPGGVWTEPFIFPADPDLLLQRTGNACINEGGFPPNSYDSENIWHFYDFECEADSGGALGCHRTTLPRLSCLEALTARVGTVETALRFERLNWDATLADQVRSGPVTTPDTPDLLVVGDDLETNRITYRYVDTEDCAIQEGAVGSSGWRRLLQFDATVHNVGGTALHIGPVVTEDPVNHVFDYNACHDHFHYSNYGAFFLQNADDLSGSKQAFCVQSTSRFSNNETSPLTHDYSCRFQGVQAGWVDEYVAGLDAQWIDITDLNVPPEGRTVQLGFQSNGDGFLCEGTAVVDENGNPLWEPTAFTTEEGEVINRPQCTFAPDWERNNLDLRDVTVPQTGSFVTAACAAGEVGPLRNCGFTGWEPEGLELTCVPGEPVLLRVQTETPQVVRACEWSAALGSGVACTYEDALVNAVVGAATGEVSFACPRIRDAEVGADAAESGAAGGFALYAAPVWPADGTAVIRTVEE